MPGERRSLSSPSNFKASISKANAVGRVQGGGMTLRSVRALPRGHGPPSSGHT